MCVRAAMASRYLYFLGSTVVMLVMLYVAMRVTYPPTQLVIHTSGAGDRNKVQYNT